MFCTNFKFFFKQYGHKIVTYVLGLIITIWIESIFIPLFSRLNQFLIGKSSPILNIVKIISFLLTITIPIYSVVLFFILVWLIYRIRYYFLINRRELKILKAEYGSGTTFADITVQLNNFIVDDKISIPLQNSVAGLDPTPGIVKVAKIVYEFNGKSFNKKIIEGKIIDLP